VDADAAALVALVVAERDRLQRLRRAVLERPAAAPVAALTACVAAVHAAAATAVVALVPARVWPASVASVVGGGGVGAARWRSVQLELARGQLDAAVNGAGSAEWSAWSAPASPGEAARWARSRVDVLVVGASVAALVVACLQLARAGALEVEPDGLGGPVVSSVSLPLVGAMAALRRGSGSGSGATAPGVLVARAVRQVLALAEGVLAMAPEVGVDAEAVRDLAAVVAPAGAAGGAEGRAGLAALLMALEA
jgi:hypothetical protein